MFILPNDRAEFNFMCIINDAKWNSFENKEELVKLSEANNSLCISDIKVKDPDNPAKLRAAKLITFYI